MAKQLVIEVDDETYEQLARLAAGGHAELQQFAAQRLTADLARLRFDEAARSFAADHGAAFAARFGAGEQGRAAA
ncbi:hypothetical protein [Streptomyces sp. NPDC053427]|uniref:hypothetical protein n=1 Tax=Streptomyces sp. NPDC053427 TaxID=3365701 RepID=UPI0037D05944